MIEHSAFHAQEAFCKALQGCMALAKKRIPWLECLDVDYDE